MWIDVAYGYINEDCVEFIEDISAEGNVKIRLHTISGRTIDMSGVFASNVLNYARLNKVQFVTRLRNPVGLDGDTL
jgi:hypothetical protein